MLNPDLFISNQQAFHRCLQKRGIPQFLQIHDKPILVGGFNPPEKYEVVSWDDDIQTEWKVIKFMFQTANQYILW